MQATGTKGSRPAGLTWLAEAYGSVGQSQQGLAVVTEAEAMIAQTDERYWVAELYRAKGELLQQQGHSTDAVEACYLQAIDIARRQAAKSLELRSTMSLCRLLQQQGRTKEGQQMLAELYAWFSEGFDTRDLIEAKALLIELAGEIESR